MFITPCGALKEKGLARGSRRCFRTEEMITGTFRWTKEEFLRVQRLAMRHSQQSRHFRRFMPVLGVLILLSGVVSIYQHPSSWGSLIPLVIFGGVFLALPFWIRRAALKMYAQKPDRDMEVTYEISESGIRSKTSLAASENSWAFFQKVVRERDGFMLYPSGSMFHWLPMHAFRDPEDIERVVDLAKSKVKEYVDAR